MPDYSDREDNYGASWEEYALPRRKHVSNSELLVDASIQPFERPCYSGWHTDITSCAKENEKVCKLGKSRNVKKCTECTIDEKLCPELNDKKTFMIRQGKVVLI